MVKESILSAMSSDVITVNEAASLLDIYERGGLTMDSKYRMDIYEYFKDLMTKNKFIESMSDTIAGALPLTPNPIPYESNKDNDYIIRVNEATSIGDDDQINDLIDVCKRMATYEYICIDDKFNVLQNSRSNFDKHRTVSSSNFKKYNGGICYDYVNYMVGLLGKFKFKTFFNGYVEKDGQIDYTHTYILVYINDKVYWIEDSWKSHMGVFEFDSEDDAISYIVNIQSKGKEYFVVEYKPSSKLVGISVIDFINIMNSKPEYNYKHNNSAKASTIYSVKLDSRGKYHD